MPRSPKPKTSRKCPPGKNKALALPPKFKTGFLTSLDGRTDLAKALRQNFDAIVEDVGGANELSHVKRALVERFVWLEGILQTLEHDIVASDPTVRGEIVAKWIQGVNSLSGLAKVLGTDRRTVVRPWLNSGEGSA